MTIKHCIILILTVLVLSGISKSQIQNREVSIDGKSSKDIHFVTNGKSSVVAMMTRIMNVPIKNVSPFLALGVVIPVESSNGNSLDVHLRYFTGRNGWSEWQNIPREEDGEQTGIIAYALQILPKEALQLQLKINIDDKEQNSFPKNIRLSFISPGETRQSLTRAQNPGEYKIASGTPPEYLSRTAWGCPEGQSSPRWEPLRTSVNHLIVHHTATSNSSSDWGAVVRSIWAYHANTLGWGDIGYNWLVDPNGVIYQGRAWWNDSLPDVRGGHFCGVSPDPNGINNNEQTMGVSMIGTYTSMPPASNALISLRNIIVWKAKELDLDPNGISYHQPTDLTINNISGHRAGCSTECPGQSLYDLLPEIRNEVDSIIRQHEITMSTIVNAGWNLFSMPVDVHYGNVDLPDGISPFFGFNCASGYTTNNIPVGGRGYWVRFSSDTELTLQGDPRIADTIDVQCEWNLIGAVSQPLASADVMSIPEGNIVSSFFEFLPGSNYTIADSLKPFKAYWVKVVSPGKLILHAPPIPGTLNAHVRK